MQPKNIIQYECKKLKSTLKRSVICGIRSLQEIFYSFLSSKKNIVDSCVIVNNDLLSL